MISNVPKTRPRKTLQTYAINSSAHGAPPSPHLTLVRFNAFWKSPGRSTCSSSSSIQMTLHNRWRIYSTFLSLFEMGVVAWRSNLENRSSVRVQCPLSRHIYNFDQPTWRSRHKRSTMMASREGNSSSSSTKKHGGYVIFSFVYSGFDKDRPACH